ncbi:mCG1036879, partial [Mus musculus]
PWHIASVNAQARCNGFCLAGHRLLEPSEDKWRDILKCRILPLHSDSSSAVANLRTTTVVLHFCFGTRLSSFRSPEA